MLFVYPAVIHPEEGGFWAEFPDLEGCFTQGDTLNEVLYNCKESLEPYILARLENDEKLPNASEINLLEADSESIKTLVQVDVDLNRSNQSVKKTLTIPKWLNDRALAKGINFSQLLQESLVEKII